MRTNMGKPGKNEAGSAIQDIRIRRGLTLRDLGERTGIDRGNLSKLERGLTNPRISTLRRVASALGVSVNRLLDAA